MERNILRFIQLESATPDDDNWEFARWGYRTFDEQINAVFVDIVDVNPSMDSQLEDGNDDLLLSAVTEVENTINETTSFLKDNNDDLLLNASINVEQLYDDNDELLLSASATNVENSNTVTGFKTTKEKTEETAHEKNLAYIRQKDSLNSNNVKEILEDMFSGIDMWPPFIVSILLDTYFGYQARLTLAAFFVGNALISPEIPLVVYKFYNKHWNNSRDWRQRLLKFENLFEYLNKANNSNNPECQHIQSTYYYYNMTVQHMMYFNGDLRVRGGERKKYVQRF